MLTKSSAYYIIYTAPYEIWCIQGSGDMYKYKIKLYPELLKQREGIDLRPTYNEVRSAALVYSEAGEKAKVKKSIDLNSIVVERDYIEFVLICEIFLQMPTKSCKYFIQQLCKLDFYKRLINTSGRLFRGISELIEETSEISTEKDYRELTDEEALIEIIKIFNRPSKENIILKQRIKKLLIGCENK